MTTTSELRGRLVLDDRVAAGRLRIEGDRIASVDVDDAAEESVAELPYLAPGFVDVHVHGWGGHSAMGDAQALDGMARALARRGVTSFLPSAWSTPIPELHAFADRVRAWIPAAPADGAEPLGFNLEGPFIAPKRKGAHNPAWLLEPASVPWSDIEPLVDGLRLTTVAPEIAGALELIGRLTSMGVRVAVGHSAATLAGAMAGYDAGGTTTTHLFNAMTGIDHRAPGVVVAALTRDDAYVELIADGEHVDPSLWPIIMRTKPTDRLLLVSDAVSLAGMGDGISDIGGLEVEVRGQRCTIIGADTLAGSVIALDSAVRNLVQHGATLPNAVAAASRNPVEMLGLSDRGRLAPGLRADVVELGKDLVVRRVMRGGDWVA
ncbi:MAG TPA: N-acetylglucosamine-6-phosphate deacetylase [Candidatus Limnocylindrales bacterium]|jgi:N-acetylglucosamine-6-phosphate deacetylase|nr:N-acetylglucosamine-6-phosphate deacetylase [Candidatus Limnocylindrales bacterium]